MDSSETYWALLREGLNGVTEIPWDRIDINTYYDPRPATPGKMVTRWRGFLEDIDKFDAYFFGISPRQAIRRYIPQAYPGRVTLFRAKSRPLMNMFDPDVGWQRLAPGRVSVIDIPSSHEGMFRKPHVEHLAQALKSCIDSNSDQEPPFPTDGIQNRLSEKLLTSFFP